MLGNTKISLDDEINLQLQEAMDLRSQIYDRINEIEFLIDKADKSILDTSKLFLQPHLYPRLSQPGQVNDTKRNDATEVDNLNEVSFKESKKLDYFPTFRKVNTRNPKDDSADVIWTNLDTYTSQSNLINLSLNLDDH